MRELRRVSDRIGIGFRPELVAGILGNLDRIDVVEVIADDLFAAPSRRIRAVQTLAAQVPVVLHGVSLGLASSLPVDRGRLDRMARIVGKIEPVFWSEHLAFVRGDGLEIGHLASPPRNEATVAGALANAERAARVVGTAPLLENVASLIDPPGSDLDEPAFVSAIIRGSGCPLLLDLNNLYTNAVNFRFDPFQALDELPLDRVLAVHLAGGKWVGERRLLDDHLHAVPDPVFELLAAVGARAPQPLSVILERDGAYPAFDVLLGELDRARASLRAGRRSLAVDPRLSPPGASAPRAPTEQAQALEAYLARLYVDRGARTRFLADPRGEASRAGLDARACESLARLEPSELELSAASFALKRERAPRESSRPSAFFRWLGR